jgi:hypothetical protein
MTKVKTYVVYVLLAFMAPLAAWTSELDKLSKEEKEKVQKGEVIYKSVKTADASGKISGYGQSMALIKAPIDKCWQIFTQYDKQQEYFPRKTESVVVEQKPGVVLVRKNFKFYWVNIGYTNRYQVDAKNYRIDYSIDPGKPHDVKDSAGFFLFEKIAPDQTLFTYAVTRLDTGIAMPSFVQEYMQKKDLPAVAENVRKRIESGGTWKKESD